jgi:hypothetical protein
MTLTVGVSKRSLVLSLVAMACAALPCLAVTPPALTIADNLGNSVTLDSTGAITYGGLCTVITCPGSSAVGSGYLGWSSLTVGTFAITNIVGETKPLLAVPALDIGIGSMNSLLGGTLTVSWTDTTFMATGPVTLSYLTSYGVGVGSTTYTAYMDPNDNPFGEESGTLIGTAHTATANETTTATANVTEAILPVSMTEVEAITLPPASLSFSNDFGMTATVAQQTVTPPTTTYSLTKTASAKTVAPFQKVTYTYVVKNTGTATLTNLTVTDDNATPTYTGDDFTVCTIASLAAGASQTCTASVYPPVTEGANDTGSWGGDWGCGNGWGNSGFNYNQAHAGGTLICKAKSNGNVQVTYLVDPGTTDNTYGTGSSSGWGWWGGSFSNLSNTAGAEFQILDSKGNTCLDFVADYVSPSSSYPSGYGTCGIKNGGGCLYSGNASNIVSIDTTITDNLNHSKAFNKCTTNSPVKNPDWQSQCGYKVEISCNAWGSKGFGGVNCPIVKHTAKNSNCSEHQIKPVTSTATNTATLIGYYGTTELAAVKATATVTVQASEQGGTSDCYGQTQQNQGWGGGGGWGW